MSQSQLGRAQFEPYYPHLERFLEWPRLTFLQPFSTKSEPFTQWNSLPFEFVTKDFCHKKIFSAKLKAKTARSTIKIKQQVSQKKNLGPLLSDEVKLWFDLPNRGVFYTKVTSLDYIKVMYDTGLKRHNSYYYYLFGGINTTKLLNNVDLRLGLGFVTQNGQCQNRIKAALAKQNTQYYWYHKSFLAHRDFRFGFLSCVNLNQLLLQKNNLLLGYHFRRDTCGYLRLSVKDFRSVNPSLSNINSYFDTVTADVIHAINEKSKAAVQATVNISAKKLDEAKLVYEYQHATNKSIKGSVNDKFGVALVAKTPLYRLEDLGTLSVGIQVDGLVSGKAQFKTGFEVNINL